MAGFVQSTGAFATTSATNIAKAYGSNVTAGNLLVACCSCAITAASTFSVTDTLTNTWASASSQAVSSAFKTQLFWTKTASSGANTVTFARSGSASIDERIIIIAEFSGTWPTTPTDNSNVGNGTTANPSVSDTVGASATLLVGHTSTTGTSTVGSGFNDLGAQDGNDAEYKLAPASGSVAVPFVAAASTWAEAVASFLETAAATVTPAFRPHRMPLGA